MADSTTTLNPGTGGDVMDESQVQQPGGTVAKRPRVVLGDDSGVLVNASVIVEQLALILLQMRRQTALLRIMIATLGDNDPDDAEILALSTEED